MINLNDFKTLERGLMTKAAQNRKPINGSLELLPLCNLNCDMCYVRLTKSEMESQGRLRTGEEWINLATEMLESGTLFMLLTGGEPLLHPDFKEIYLALKKMGMILTINTNATLIDESWAEFFGKHKPRRINITLYGTDNVTYEKLCHYPNGYDKVIHAIKLLKANNVDVKLGCSATPANVDSILAMYEIAKELDVPLTTDAYMMPSTRERCKPFDEQSRLLPEDAASIRVKTLELQMGKEQFFEYCRQVIEWIDTFEPGKKEAGTNSCMAGHCSFSVNWQGYLRPCVITTEPSVSAFDVGFQEAWRHVSKTFTATEYCSDCSICPRKIICSPCPVASKTETGDYMDRPDYLCRYAEETERLIRLHMTKQK